MKEKYLNILVFGLMLFALTGNILAEDYDVTTLDKRGSLKEVTIYGKRSIKDVGATKTTFDSTMLKENIAQSMADVLGSHSSLYIKSYGRATLSTVSFRGTSPSHTQVTWNGMRLNNPMLGMTDFSMIPSYFIDDASLLHGTSSVNETGGGLGGSVKMSTKPANSKGFGLQYIQGIGSFNSFDEFLRLTYGDKHWQVSTRAVLSTSPNNFTYKNHDKKENIYDENMNIIDQYYPIEENKSGAYKDFHILQEAYYNTGTGHKIGINAWYLQSYRELPMLTTDYAENTSFENAQRERTFRGILSYDFVKDALKLAAKCGYVNTYMAYDYKRDIGNGSMASMTESRSNVNTAYAQADAEYYIGNKWLFTANLSFYQHFVESKDKNIIKTDGNTAIVGYKKARTELSGAVSAKWQPTDRFGTSIVIRDEMFGDTFSPIIPAFFIDGVLWPEIQLMAKASVSRNYRFPSLNDMYFLPGGNPNLKPESGWTYDAGLSFNYKKEGICDISGSATWFDSYIKDWILWLPTTKGFFSPKNIKDVHAYGVEIKSNNTFHLSKNWRLDLEGTFSWTPSINNGEPMSKADKSVGKQLPYVPEYVANFSGKISYKTFSFLYKWSYYSERYTMSSNDVSLSGRLPEYFMSNITIEKLLQFSWSDISLKFNINNLFNEEYLSVLSRPMPGINFQLFLGITPKW
jgi:iron complex outermembrane receptor protein